MIAERYALGHKLRYIGSVGSAQSENAPLFDQAFPSVGLAQSIKAPLIDQASDYVGLAASASLSALIPYYVRRASMKLKHGTGNNSMKACNNSWPINSATKRCP